MTQGKRYGASVAHDPPSRVRGSLGLDGLEQAGGAADTTRGEAVKLAPPGKRQSETWAYRWTVVGVSTAVNSLAWGSRSTFALFYVAMLEEFTWGRGPTALGYSLSW